MEREGLYGLKSWIMSLDFLFEVLLFSSTSIRRD